MLFKNASQPYPTSYAIINIHDPAVSAKKEKDLLSVTVHGVRQHMRGPSSFKIQQ